MVEIYGVVAVDVQALVKEFDPVDGAVKLVNMKESGFFLHILHIVGVLEIFFRRSSVHGFFTSYFQTSISIT
ncbi:hypothetical protein Bca52824_033002 [Brassica carinata]|uniref:Uncharacterized protein n=1 Tax=Brassica carinata TaxID=52824 RepID=A0A8X7V833_BRACI|nr:hypothetical protein Bca52824_033002 [Brassica carinata]